MAKKIAVIWGDALSEGDKPFQKDYQNSDYRIYSEIAEKKSLELLYGHYDWYEDGKLRKAFYWTGNEWEMVFDVSLDGVFDKFPFNEETESVKKALNRDLPVVNDFELEKLCKDKLKSSEEFPEFFPDTTSEEFLEDMIEEYGKVIVKPRYGHGGEDVNIVESSEDLKLKDDVEYVIQKFVKASGVPIPGVEGRQHDLRIVFVNNKPVYTYVRTPKDDDSVSNVAKQGSITYIDLEDVPEKVMNAAREISGRLEGYRPCLFSVDFIVSKPGMYFSDSEGKEEYERPGVEALIDALAEL
jgi:glutathione synthase/RimK-type ligase-like ATP-grasp enzyme